MFPSSNSPNYIHESILEEDSSIDFLKDSNSEELIREVFNEQSDFLITFSDDSPSERERNNNKFFENSYKSSNLVQVKVKTDSNHSKLLEAHRIEIFEKRRKLGVNSY